MGAVKPNQENKADRSSELLVAGIARLIESNAEKLDKLVEAVSNREPPKIEAPKVTVEIPKRGAYEMTVTARDGNGRIERVTVTPV